MIFLKFNRINKLIYIICEKMKGCIKMCLRGYIAYPSYSIQQEKLLDNKSLNQKVIFKGKECQTYDISTFLFYIKKSNANENENENELVLNNEKPKELVFIVSKFYNFINPYGKLKGDYFAFMIIRIIHNRNESEKNDALIGYSENPFYSTLIHNKLKNGKDLIGKEWKLSIILGPFILKKNCIECCQGWLYGTRGIASKQIRAYELQKNYGVNFYTSEFSNFSHLENLIKKLPKKYYDTFNLLKKEIK